jgi:hypothetical protein
MHNDREDQNDRNQVSEIFVHNCPQSTNTIVSGLAGHRNVPRRPILLGEASGKTSKDALGDATNQSKNYMDLHRELLQR